METRIGENIRFFRKERSMTQEQLAEAVGVTAGAIYKWEAHRSIPDIGLIMELAELFEISVDVLLGFELKSGKVDAMLARIEQYQRNQDFEMAAAQAERALQKFPNNFKVVYRCAKMYSQVPYPFKRAEHYRALELFQKSCTLIDQNTDDSISLISIQNQIAEVYVAIGEYENAIKILKKNNYGGLNNSLIGKLLVANCQRTEEGLGYLSDALEACSRDLYYICVGYINAYTDQKKYDQALDMLHWLKNVYAGLRKSGKVSFYDKWDAKILFGCAEISAVRGNWEEAACYLKQAREAAEKFDAAPDYSTQNLKYYHGTDDFTMYDSPAETAMEYLRKHLLDLDESGKLLIPIWNQLEQEKEVTE